MDARRRGLLRARRTRASGVRQSVVSAHGFALGVELFFGLGRLTVHPARRCGTGVSGTLAQGAPSEGLPRTLGPLSALRL